MHTRMLSKVGYMGIKFDMSKAYDKVEWAFLEAVMKKMEFPDRWIRLIMECVCTVSYAILINSQPVGNILSPRGLQKGDPISPYLFLICAEALNSLLTQAEKRGLSLEYPRPKMDLD